MSQPANFDSVTLDGILADWMSALRSDAVDALVILGPDPLDQSVPRHVLAVHPPRLHSLAQALAQSDDWQEVAGQPRAALAVWQDISRGHFSESSRWRVLALSHGLQSVVRVAFDLPRNKAFECYLFTPRALHEKTQAACLVWSVLNMWPQVREAIAAVTCPLSTREKECLALALDGLTAYQTCQALECSERTVNYYLSNAMRKLGVDTKLAAAERAMWYGAL